MYHRVPYVNDPGRRTSDRFEIHVKARIECAVSCTGERPEGCISWRLTDGKRDFELAVASALFNHLGGDCHIGLAASQILVA